MEEEKTEVQKIKRKRRRGNGEGTISQRQDGYWVGMVTIGIDPRTMKQQRKSVVRKQRQDVVTEMKKMQTSQQKGTLVKTDKNTTLEQWFDQWLNGYKRVSIKASTYTNYLAAIKWLTPDLGAYKLQKLHRLAIQKFINMMVDKKLAPRTINDCINLLSNCLKYAVKHKLIENNPCELVEKPTNVKKEMKIWSLEQLMQFKNISKGYYLEPAMNLLMHGMRRGEILGLCCENLHLDDGYLCVRNNLVITCKGILLEPTPKTSASSRDIPPYKRYCRIIKKAHRY